jgi:hypothetical protein
MLLSKSDHQIAIIFLRKVSEKSFQLGMRKRNFGNYDQFDDIAFGGSHVTSLVGLAVLLVDLREGKQFNERRLEEI